MKKKILLSMLVLLLAMLVTAIPLASANAPVMTDSELALAPQVYNPDAEPVRFRARDLGVETGIYLTGKDNAITDVQGVLVGQKTVWKDPPPKKDISHRVRSGATAILPHAGNMYKEKAPCAIYLGNAFGKLAGYTQVKELGTLETPILLTGTLNVPKVADAVIEYMLFNPELFPGMEGVRSINPVVGETNDGRLNDLRARPVEEQDVFDALADAKTGPVLEGSVGAGTGTHCLGWKGGIGTASRVIPPGKGGYTVGVLVQTNFGGLLTINGAPVGRELGRFSYSYDIPYDIPNEANSCMVIVATDAPLCARNLERLAKRAMYGLVKCGSYSSNGSGDYLIAFSTAYTMPYDGPVELLNNSAMSRLFMAVDEAAEEAVLNSMFQATTVVGRDDNRLDAIPLEDVIEVCQKYDVLFAHSKIAPWAPTTKEATVEDNAVRLEELVGYVSSADIILIPAVIKTSLLDKLDAAIEKNSEALAFIDAGNANQANNALADCSTILEDFKSEVEASSQIQQPYVAMFVSRADLGIWICDKAIALPIE